MTDTELMREALREAELAAALGEVPVGAVVARNGEIVARAHNLRESGKGLKGHAVCHGEGRISDEGRVMLNKHSLCTRIIHELLYFVINRECHCYFLLLVIGS